MAARWRPPGDDPFDRVAYSNRPTTQDIVDKGLSAEINWDTPWFGGATLTSITASRQWEAINGLDYDFSTADLLYRNADQDESFTGFDTFSQELRLTGSSERIDWMVGAFYSDEELTRNETYRIGPHYEPYVSTLVYQLVSQGLAAAGVPLNNPNNISPDAFLAQVGGRPFGTGFTGLGSLDRYKQDAKSLALFTNNTWHATDALDLTLGLRYTREKKDLTSSYSNPSGSLACSGTLADQNAANPNRFALLRAALASRSTTFANLPVAVQNAIMAGNPATPDIPGVGAQIAGYMCLPWANALHNGRNTFQEMDDKEWSGTVKAAYRWNENVMTYASYARGYKGGGFNLDRVQSSNGLSSGSANGIQPVLDTSFGGEFVDSFELGAKTTWLDGNLLLNATLFHQKYEDFQLNSFLGTSFVVRSIPEVTSQGLDAELMWQPKSIRGLMLQSGLMYADTKYGDNIPGCDFVGPGQTSAACPSVGALYKLQGAQMSFAPKWSGSAAITYEWDIGNLMARFNIGAKYVSKYNTGSDLDPEKMQDAYTVANARFGIGAQDQRWMLEFWGTNITDEDYVQVGFDGPLQNVSPAPNNPFNTFNAFLGAPRMYGVTLRVRY